MIPGSVSGDLFKAYFIAKEQSRRTIAVATIFLDRIVGLVALVNVVALLGCIFWFTGSLQAMVPEAEQGKFTLIIIVSTARSSAQSLPNTFKDEDATA